MEVLAGMPNLSNFGLQDTGLATIDIEQYTNLTKNAIWQLNHQNAGDLTYYLIFGNHQTFKSGNPGC